MKIKKGKLVEKKLNKNIAGDHYLLQLRAGEKGSGKVLGQYEVSRNTDGEAIASCKLHKIANQLGMEIVPNYPEWQKQNQEFPDL